MKTLIAYFSAGGTTARMAGELASALQGDVFEIKPEQPYTVADLKWTNPLARCNREKLGKKDVALAALPENWEGYDRVCLGFPIWYYGAPNVVNSFCKKLDWAGKSVVLFATSGGSDIGKTAEKLKPYMKGDPIIISAGVYKSASELIEKLKGSC